MTRESEVVKSTKLKTDTDGSIEQKSVVERSSNKLSGLGLVGNIIMTVYGLIAGILSLRFILSLFGANKSNDFASLVYGVTEPLVTPFKNLFSINENVGNGLHRFEVETLIAIIVYGLIVWAIFKLLTIREPEA